MTIRVVRINPKSPLIEVEPVISILVTGHVDVVAFEELVSRGIRSWDQALHQIKTAADEIRFGEALQNYKIQSSKGTHNS